MNYQELFTFENLYQAHKNARKGKRNKKDVILFELELSKNLWDLYDALSSQTYSPCAYQKFYVFEPKKREIQALPYKDRVVQHVLADHYLYPLLTSKLIYDNGACQKGKGTDFSLNRLTSFFTDFYKKSHLNGYILKADIRKYFPSIQHDVLKQKLNRIVEDKDILQLLFRIIDSYENTPGRGLPMGNQTSQLFALYYMDSLDRLCKEKLRLKFYVRYMDDIVILHPDKIFLITCLEMMRQYVQDELKLEFNEKTHIFPLKNGVDFLGFHFYMTDTGKVIRKLRDTSKKKFKHRLRKLKRQYAMGEVDTADIQRILPGYHGHLARGHTYRLKKAVFRDFILKRRFEEVKNEQENT